MRKSLILFLLLLLLALPSCRNQPDVDYPNVIVNEWGSLFEAYWSNMNKNYIMFSLDYSGTKWDEVYDEYKGKFDELGEIGENQENDMKAFRYLFDIVKNLKDGHYKLQIDQDISFGPYSYRTYKELGLTDDRIFNISLNLEERDPSLSEGETASSIFTYTFGINNETPTGPYHKENILNGRSFIGSYVKRTAMMMPNALLGLIDGKILYFAFDVFAFSPFLDEEDGNDVKDLYNEFKALLDDEQVKGVIIDLRENGGGRNTDLDYLWGLFTSEKIAYSEIAKKDGPNREDFTPWQKERLRKAERESNFDKPIALLFNRGSASCSEISLMIFDAFKKDLNMDIRTFGSSKSAGLTCSLSDNQIATETVTVKESMLNGGSFTIYPYLIVTTTPSILRRSIDGEFYEGIGFSPDVLLPYADIRSGFESGNDPILNAALSWLERK